MNDIPVDFVESPLRAYRSPSKAQIDDNPDPICQTKYDEWWFYDELWETLYGPFPSKFEAKKSLIGYCMKHGLMDCVKRDIDKIDEERSEVEEVEKRIDEFD